MADSNLSFNFTVLVITSCLLATLGLLSNSAGVIIGAMLVAPLMLPLRGLAFGALEGDTELFRRSLTTLGIATLTALALSTILGKLIGLQEFGSEVLARTQPTLIDLGVAVVAGGLSGFSKVRTGISDAVAGTAIAVALMPPLCVVGLTLSQGFLQESYGALLLYWTNLLGITLACMMVFVLAGYARANKALGWAFLMTGGLFLPLGISLIRLLNQANLEATLKQVFQEETKTGQRVELLQTNVFWTDRPIQVYLRVRSKDPVTPTQVQLVQEFLAQKNIIKKPFELVFWVEPFEEVRGINSSVELTKPRKNPYP
ncbi:MAG: TIGR00341 family protein [Oscillatoriales cyanobacterium RM2_1_1]|nr:TIGR00341 family protein [Oscillatoriales cyanobacterium SM2_3_0]NJO47522.1 TIGR00341 family protein [Oscillatoriales cyanobacterium RM2_1_1]